jgi:hypothetical protein
MRKTKPTKPATNALQKTAARPRRRLNDRRRNQQLPVHRKQATSAKPGKINQIIAMLRRPNGASIIDLTKVTAWQAHSIRGAISGALRKKRGLNIVSAKSGDVRLYRIADKAVS